MQGKTWKTRKKFTHCIDDRLTCVDIWDDLWLSLGCVGSLLQQDDLWLLKWDDEINMGFVDILDVLEFSEFHVRLKLWFIKVGSGRVLGDWYLWEMDIYPELIWVDIKSASEFV